MNTLMAAFFREALAAFAGKQIRTCMNRLVGVTVYYVICGLLLLAAIAFLYVLLYVWLEQIIYPVAAAGILFAGNLILALLMLTLRRKPKAGTERPFSAAERGSADSPVKLGIAIGQNIRLQARRAAPKFVMVAAATGLIIGFRPQILRLLTGGARRGRAKAKAARR